MSRFHRQIKRRRRASADPPFLGPTTEQLARASIHSTVMAQSICHMLMADSRTEGASIDALFRMFVRKAEQIPDLAHRMAGDPSIDPDDIDHPNYVTEEAMAIAPEFASSLLALAGGAIALLAISNIPDEILEAVRPVTLTEQ